MPLNVRRFFASVFLLLFAVIFINAQTAPPPSAPTTADVMRERISKAKAFIVVKNYNAAIYELENIRRETKDPNINAMLNVLLMHSYLEQTDYKRAQDFLDVLYKDLKAKKPNAEVNYYAVAGQIVKGARSQIDRYKSVGLMVSDRNLPLEALVDIDKMRETLEIVITESKELGADKKQTQSALPLLEEAINTRTALAKDEYDANRWKLEVADAREDLVKSKSTIINAVDGTSENVSQNTVAQSTPNTNNQTVSQNTPTVKTPENIPSLQTVQTSAEKPKTDSSKTVMPDKITSIATEPTAETKQSENTNKSESPTNSQRRRLIVGQSVQPNDQTLKKEVPPAAISGETIAQTVVPNDNSPLTVGSLLEYATKRVNPVYPPQARTMRLTGVVKVEVMVDEEGNVTEVQNTNGPSLLQRAAVDAVRKWQFKPFVRNGLPIKATGFVSFNFSL